MFESLYLLFGNSPYNPPITSAIFNFIGLCLLFIPPVLSALFYRALNGFGYDKMSGRFHWILFLLLTMALLFGLTLLISTTISQDTVNPYFIVIGIVNAILAAVIFLAASVFLKKGSKQAKYTPFDYIPFKK